MEIAIGQLRVDADPDRNLEQIADLARRSEERSARLLLLPEGLVCRDPRDPNASADHPQALDGPFMSALAGLSARHRLAIVGSIHVPTGGPKVTNTGFILDHGELLAAYRKIHLYDAFSARESVRVEPGREEPPVVGIDGLAVGLMICYDLRFPEVARSLAVRGAQLIVVPSAWASGPLKEMHWRLLASARALENTVYLAACSETSAVDIGTSLLVDPLGVSVAAAGHSPELLLAEVSPDRIAAARRALPVLSNRGYRDPELRRPGEFGIRTPSG